LRRNAKVNIVDILFCQCAYAQIIPAERKGRVLAGLAAAGAKCTAVPDLCGLAARKEPLLAELAGQSGLKIVACHPRAVRWLFHRAGAPLQPGRFEVFNMRVQEADEILARLAPGSQGAAAPPPEAASEGDWIPWFPVIDYERCTNCKQCLEFCLFGVYEADSAGKVTVTNPASCKTHCPACARICPQAAIVFPKVEDAPINGAEVADEALAHAQAKINIEEILGDNIYAALAKRRAKRKALLRKSGAKDGHQL
jgi:NAD-dependent dihydropyrimidine dehydrogenase PreA subunit